MSSLLVIPDANAKGGGSGRGVSYWTSFLGCHEEYKLNQEGEGSSEAARVGTLFHKLCELYYNGTMEGAALQYAPGPQDADWLEAQRLFGAYRSIYPRDEFAGVVANELPLLATDLSKYGVDQLTGRADMVVDVAEENCARINQTRKLDLTPGRYLVDFKTKGQKKESLELEYQGSLQFHSYMMMLEDMGMPVKGCFASVIIRHKKLEREKSFWSIYVPAPSEQDRIRVKNTLAKCMKMRDTFGIESNKNPDVCFTYKACPHLLSGRCDRTPKG